MGLDFRNTNTVWASVLVETLARAGLQTAIACPGSRSTPLTFAFAAHPGIEAIPVLDERSAAFFALGIAKRTGRPTAIVCTSGTAGANFYPAAIEARESRVPLLILTADRPPELRDCHSGQAIDQVRLYGNYPNWYAELAVPSLDWGLLRYLRQTIRRAWGATLAPTPGVVHLNCPFRDPLPPLSQPEAMALESSFAVEEFFAATETRPQRRSRLAAPWHDLAQKRGIIIAGVAQPRDPETYCKAIAHLSQALGYPVLAEGLSPVRNYAAVNPHLISTYDIILRNPQLATRLAPEVVIQVGDFPTSKVLRAWIDAVQPQRIVIDPSDENLDPLHGKTTHWQTSVDRLEIPASLEPPSQTEFPAAWDEAETAVRTRIDRALGDIEEMVEPKIAWCLSQVLPPQTALSIANSMPVRDVEFFWKPSDRAIQPYFNRGANGIDGTLSTALGVAHRGGASVLLTGDLALLHDTNGFLLRDRLAGHLTIILINNHGGGIFEMLPVSQFDPPFEEFFATPQSVDFRQLCATYGVEYRAIASWMQLEQAFKQFPDRGIRVLEIQCDRKFDARWRKTRLDEFSRAIEG